MGVADAKAEGAADANAGTAEHTQQFSPIASPDQHMVVCKDVYACGRPLSGRNRPEQVLLCSFGVMLWTTTISPGKALPIA